MDPAVTQSLSDRIAAALRTWDAALLRAHAVGGALDPDGSPCGLTLRRAALESDMADLERRLQRGPLPPSLRALLRCTNGCASLGSQRVRALQPCRAIRTMRECGDDATVTGVLDAFPELASAVLLNELDTASARWPVLLLLQPDRADPLSGEWPATYLALHDSETTLPDCVQLLELLAAQEPQVVTMGPLSGALNALDTLQAARDVRPPWAAEDPAQAQAHAARAPRWARARALLAACERGDAALVESLMREEQAVAGAVDERGRGALHYAAARGHEAIVRLLLERGALPHIQDAVGLTALDLAAAAQRAAVCDALSAVRAAHAPAVLAAGSRGARPTPLALAAAAGGVETATVLLRYALRDDPAAWVQPLQAACLAGHAEAARALVGELPEETRAQVRGALLEGKDGAALVRAVAWRGPAEVLPLLAHLGADLSARSEHGWTALHAAAASGQLVTCRELVAAAPAAAAERAGWLDAVTDGGETPLSLAARGGFAQVCEVLLAAGASLGAGTRSPLLLAASVSGSEQVCALLLRAGCTTDVTDGAGLPLLHAAAARGHVSALRVLLPEAGAAAGAAGASDHALHVEALGETAVEVAARGGHADAVTLLLLRGARLRQAGAVALCGLNGATWRAPPLSAWLAGIAAGDAAADAPASTAPWLFLAAAHAGLAEACRQWLARADSDATRQRLLDSASLPGGPPRPALHAACLGAQGDAAGAQATLRVLLEQRADVRARDAAGGSLLHAAARSGVEAVCVALLRSEAVRAAAVAALPAPGVTALHACALHNMAEACRLLLEAGADPVAPARDAATPLHYAAARGQVAACRTLAGWGGNSTATVTARTRSQCTPLHWAARGRHADACLALLECGADVDAADGKGMRPLMLAAEAGSAEVVRLLLHHNASLAATRRDGATALHVAAGSGEAGAAEAVRELLERGCDAAHMDNRGISLLRLALGDGSAGQARERWAVLAAVLDAGVDGNAWRPPAPPLLHWASCRAMWRVALLVCCAGADVAAVNPQNGQTVLHVGSLEVIQLLASVARDELASVLNRPDAKGITPLHAAVKRSAAPVCELLVQLGADTEATDPDGHRPIDLAAPAWRVAMRAALGLAAP